MSSDDMNTPTPEDQDAPTVTNSLLSVEQSRRKFLRTAVIGTAGVAGAAGVAGIVLSQHGAGPNLLTIAAISGVSDGDYTMLFEDTACGTSGNANDCGDYSTLNFTVNKPGTATNPGSFFIVLAIRGLPADSFTIAAQEKLSTAGSYSNVPDAGSATAALPFAYQAAYTTTNQNIQTYVYPSGTITGSGPYALNAAPYNSPSATDSGATFTTTQTQDVLIFIHVNWGGGTIGASGATETIDFQITLTGNSTGSATETCSTTAVQA